MSSWADLDINKMICDPGHYPTLGLYGAGGFVGSGHRTALIKPPRTEELQSLYNRWRELEDRQNFEHHLPHNEDHDQLHLHSAAPSQASSDRPSSEVSGYLGAEDSELANQGKKPRRRGPLSKIKREKTAFIRRLGACPPCRSRKVGCKHWNLREFEHSYRMWKDRRKSSTLDSTLESTLETTPWECLDNEPSGGPQPSVLLSLATTAFAPRCPRTNLNPASRQSSLSVDILMPPTLVPLFPQACPGLSNAASFGAAQLMRSVSVMAIGRRLSSMCGKTATWQCQFWDGQHARPIRAATPACSHRCSTPEELTDHVFKKHQPLELYDPPIWFKCRQCGQWNDKQRYCHECGKVDSEKQEQWIYGYGVCRPPTESRRCKAV
ncbi:hypothetical protein ACJZ2D_009586 [Fusarium nematophilum]